MIITKKQDYIDVNIILNIPSYYLYSADAYILPIFRITDIRNYFLPGQPHTIIDPKFDSL